jgi:hypothetical protein
LNATNLTLGGTEYLRLTLPKPAANPAYFGWDFSDYDANIQVRKLDFGIPKGTIISLR